LRWVIDKDFPPHVAEICKAALERTGDELIAWARQRFGQPAPTAQPPFAQAQPPAAPQPAAPPPSAPQPSATPSAKRSKKKPQPDIQDA
jgi:hypothetical protein